LNILIDKSSDSPYATSEIKNDKAKPAARQGRNATGLNEMAGLPKGDPAFFIIAI
jgi:hypothetical protein